VMYGRRGLAFDENLRDGYREAIEKKTEEAPEKWRRVETPVAGCNTELFMGSHSRITLYPTSTRRRMLAGQGDMETNHLRPK
jgi:sulfur transfer protein SufE